MGLFYRCIVTYTLFDEVIDDISWNYMPEPGCPNADSESSNLVSLQSHPLFQKDASMSSTSNLFPVFKKMPACLQHPLIVLFSERCLHVFNPTSTAAREPVLGL